MGNGFKTGLRALLGLALCLAMGASFGQSDPPALDHPLSLKECVRIAVEQNPDIASALHSGRSALARVGSSKASYWPSVDFGASLRRSYSEPEGSQSRQGLIFSSQTTTATDASLSAQYTIWDSGQRKAAVQGAGSSYRASDARYSATVQDLALSVQSAYFTLQGALWALQVSEDTLKQADFHLDMAQARNGVGLAPRSDVLKAATAQADARLGVIQAQSLVDATRSNLASLMGLAADSPLQIEPAPKDAELPDLPPWFPGWERAKATLPELRAAFETAESLRFSYLEAKAAYRPTVAATGTAGLFDAGSWPDRQEWSAGLVLRIPVFTGFARKYQVLQAREAWEGSKADEQSALLAAESKAYSARITLNQAIQSVSAAKAYLASAQENSDVAEGQYNSGLGSMLDVVDAATALSSAKLRLIQARLNVALAQAAWERSTGLDLLDGLSPTPTAPLSKNGDTKP